MDELIKVVNELIKENEQLQEEVECLKRLIDMNVVAAYRTAANVCLRETKGGGSEQWRLSAMHCRERILARLSEEMKNT